MDIEKLLREGGSLEARLRAWEQAGGPSQRDQSGAGQLDPNACWPRWRIALALSSAPEVFARWWEAHGASCRACSLRRRQVPERAQAQERDLAPERPGPTTAVLHVLLNVSWSKSLAWAADTGPRIGTAEEELPRVEYHRIEGPAMEGVSCMWGVTWDNALFLLVAGLEEALEKWRSAPLVVSRSGRRLGSFVKADESVVSFLAPHESLAGIPTCCLQCQVSVAELVGDTFNIPSILSGEIRLVPADAVESQVQRLVADLVLRNRTSVFLSSLPEAVGSSAEALTLNFYLRILYHQKRLDKADRQKLQEYSWLADDLKRAFQSS